MNLKELLLNDFGIVMGQSAGAINMAVHYFNSPEEFDGLRLMFFDGLGLINMNMEPHFV